MRLIHHNTDEPSRSALSLRSFLIRGFSNLALTTIVERALGFAANSLAARVAGPVTFGAYSVVMSTANLFSTYAGAGIGSTANRFAGQYPVRSKGHLKLLHHLLTVSAVSVLLAMTLMFFAAPVLATAVLKTPQLEITLKWAAFSTGLAIMVECFRGLFIGEENFKPLFATCSMTAFCLAFLLPIGAHIGLLAMVKAQIAVSLAAVVVSGIVVWRLIRRLRGASTINGDGPKLSTIAGFGLAQLGATAGISLASWWVSILLIRGDPSFRQMGFYSVSNQVRGMLAVGPTILGQIIYSALAKERGDNFGGPQRVTEIATYLNTTFVLVLLIGLLPMITKLMTFVYGHRYQGCELVVTLGLATVVAHMSGVPAALRLSIVSIRMLAAINIMWTVVVSVAACMLVPRYGAVGAAAAYLIAHTCSQILAVLGLWMKSEIDGEFLRLSFLISITAIAIGALACVEYSHPVLTAFLQITSMLLPSVVIVKILRRPDVSAWFSFGRLRHARDFVS